MPNLNWKDVSIDDARESDYDIGDGMNLYFKLIGQKMAYPIFQFQSDSGKTKPSLLVISDSFYWVIYGSGFSNAFSDSHFGYYNQQFYSPSFQNDVSVNDINLKDEIQKHDVIIIMATNANLKDFGWGFIEKTYNMFKGITKPRYTIDFMKKVFKQRNDIKTDKNWMTNIEKKAHEKNIPIDSMITLDAIWVLEHKN